MMYAPQVLRGAQHQREVYTGQRRALEAEYDFRSFFIVGDRERLFRRIDSRCTRKVGSYSWHYVCRS